MATVDAVQAPQLPVDQWTRHRAFCSYCLVGAGATFATLPLVLPEAREAWENVEEATSRAALRFRRSPPVTANEAPWSPPPSSSCSSSTWGA